MSESVVIAIIGLVSSVVAAIIASTSSSRATRDAMLKEQAKSHAALSEDFKVMQATTDTKIDNLTKEVEKHNSVIERTFKLEQNTKNLSERYDLLLDLHKETDTIARHAAERADAANNRLDRSGVDTN